MNSVRNYDLLIERIQKIGQYPSLTLQKIGTLSLEKPFPIFKISTSIITGSKKRVLLSAGIHGDEPAGVETICRFLEYSLYEYFEEEWEFTFLPCLNPWGYEMNTRYNRNDLDLNRLFKNQVVPPEIAAAQSVFGFPFDLNIELHEDIDSSGYYLFIKGDFDPFLTLAEKILDTVSSIMPINLSSEIEERNAERGIIYRLPEPEEMEWWPMSIYAVIQKVPCSLTLETSTLFSMETRVKAHTAAVEIALKQYKDMN